MSYRIAIDDVFSLYLTCVSVLIFNIFVSYAFIQLTRPCQLKLKLATFSIMTLELTGLVYKVNYLVCQLVIEQAQFKTWLSEVSGGCISNI